MASFRKRGKVWYYRFVDADGIKRELPGCSDRRATEEIARHAESDAAKTRAGLIDPKDAAYRHHEARPLVEHLHDWHDFLTGDKTTSQHAQLSRNRVRRIVDMVEISRISEMVPSKVQAALATIRDEGASLRSVHHYLRAIKGFSRWLWRDGRARDVALATMQGPNPDIDRRHERRALTASEQGSLIHAAEHGPEVLGMTGADRAMAYRVALGTGFRANEIRSLTLESFDLETDPSTVTVEASYSKRRRRDLQPIRRNLANALSPWLASKASGARLFPLPEKTAVMMRCDLKAAGIAYRDASDRVADFHALRHSYISSLAKSGAPIKIVQTLARHSDPKLTLGVYSHVGLFDQSAALDALPDLTPTAPISEPMAKTGTDDQPIKNSFAHYLPTRGDGKGGFLKVADVMI